MSNLNKVIKEIKALQPKARIALGYPNKVKLTHYKARVVKGEIEVEELSCYINLTSNISELLKNKYFTWGQARDAIKEVIPDAIKKRDKCLSAHIKLLSELDFSLNYHKDSWTDMDYESIYFRLKDFDFQFEI